MNITLPDFINFFCLVAVLLLGAFVFISNKGKKINILFSIMTLMIVFWIFPNLIFGFHPTFFWLKAEYAMGILPMPFAIVWIRYFRKGAINIPEAVIVLGLGLLFSVLTLSTDLILSGVSIINALHFEMTTGPLYTYFSLAQLIFMFWLIISTYRGRKEAKSIVKSQLTFILLGVSLFAAIGLAYGLYLLPILHFTAVGPLDAQSSLIFVAFSAYAIVKHRLMDIRMVVARSVSYALLLLLLAGIYAGSVLGLEKIFFPNEYNSFSLTQGALRTVITVVMVFLFQPLKKWITKVTDRIFFRNAYDTDELLGKFSSMLSSTIVLNDMVYKSSEIIVQEMKSSRILFALIRDENRLYTAQAIGYRTVPEVEPHDVLYLSKDGLVISDELEDSSSRKRMLRQYDAAVAVPLKLDKEVVGVIFLGEKSSGDMYSKQDLDVLEIVAPEIAVAIENAKAYEEINRFNVTLRHEVKRATSRLKQKNQQLTELDHAKDEFISMASHQLRTPLTAIKGYLSMLLEGDAGDIKVSQYDFINEAYNGANRMVGLINDLLNVSRMDTGRFFLEQKDVDIECVVEEEINQLQNAAKTKGLYLKLEKKGRVPHIWVDETKIRQVVMNFMDNAIYYTNTGGVTVVLSHDEKNFIYEVLDTGIGVPEAQVSHLFEKFFRADNARTARPDGTGLGIYLAKRVIEDHGGEIIFRTTPGKGSVFGFKMPLKVTKQLNNGVTK